jgi:N-acetylglucosaminyl-diphospho-decaprenol L-rhamnosyltransferase
VAVVIAILIVAYNGHAMTVECLESLTGLPDGTGVWLLDNGSDPPLEAGDVPLARRQIVRALLRSDVNLGFAGGMNRLLSAALADPAVDSVLLLNNDTRPTPGFLQAMQARLDPPRTGMVAARLLQADDPGSVDSLGIALYRAGLASNRKHGHERLLGPTGGCMLLSRQLLEDVQRTSGEWFDPAFFCYAEDTDLVMRARWLGYGAAYAADAVVLHRGSATSGGPDNDFVLYHGIRNSIWALAKNAPATWLLVHLPWLLAAHAGIWLRNLRKGRAWTLWRLYRDAIAGLPGMLRKRRHLVQQRQLPARAWFRWVQPSLYEAGYLRRALRELFSRRG